MRKNKHAVALGRNGGKATARKLTKPERIASARHAAEFRWARHRHAMRVAAQQESCQVADNGENK